MDETLTELVLRAVELVPPGRAVSYGDLAELVGTGPRQVGAIMARSGAPVAWWRVTNHAGELPDHLLSEALRHWRLEGTPLKRGGHGIRLGSCRADLALLAADFDVVSADLPTPRASSRRP